VNDERNGARWSSLAGGVILIGVGALFLAETLDLADFGSWFHDYWPMFIVAVGIPKLFDRERRGGGIWLIAVGIWLQISNLGLFGLDWSSSWPILLILAGAGMVLHAILDAAAPKRGSEGGDRHAPHP
jgi:hypothetical protein